MLTEAATSKTARNAHGGPGTRPPAVPAKSRVLLQVPPSPRSSSRPDQAVELFPRLSPQHHEGWTGRALLGSGFLPQLWPASLPSPTSRTCPLPLHFQRGESSPSFSSTGQVLGPLSWSPRSSSNPKIAGKEVVGPCSSEEWVKNMCGLIALQLLGHRQSVGRRGREGVNLNLKNQKVKKEGKAAVSLRPGFVLQMLVTDWPPHFART